MCPPSSLNSASSKNSFNTKKWKLRNHKDTFKIHKDHIWLLYSPLLSWLRIWTLEREVLWQEVRFPPFYYLELNRITAVPQKANIKLNETNQHLFAFCSAASCAAPSRSPLSLSLRPLMKTRILHYTQGSSPQVWVKVICKQWPVLERGPAASLQGGRRRHTAGLSPAPRLGGQRPVKQGQVCACTYVCMCLYICVCACVCVHLCVHIWCVCAYAQAPHPSYTCTLVHG